MSTILYSKKRYRILSSTNDEDIGQGNYGKVRKVTIETSPFTLLECAHKTHNVYEPYDKETDNKTETFAYFGIHSSIMSEILVLKKAQLTFSTRIIPLIDVVYHEPDYPNSVSFLMERGSFNLREYFKLRPSIQDLSSSSLNFQAEFVATQLHIANEISLAIDQLHNLGFISCDIKPCNILYDPFSKSIKLIDFGLSELMCGWKTSNREKVTWTYRSPELFLYSPHYTESVDIWSLGCLFCELFFQEFFIVPPEHADDECSNITVFDVFGLFFEKIGFPSQDWLLKHFPNKKKREEIFDVQTFPIYFDSTRLSNSSTRDQQQILTRFLRKIIPDKNKRDFMFRLYGQKLMIQISRLILRCLAFDGNLRPTAKEVSQTLFPHQQPPFYPQQITIPRKPITSSLNVSNQFITKHINNIFDTYPQIKTPFTKVLYTITQQLGNTYIEFNKKVLTPTQISFIVTSIVVKYFRLHHALDDSGERFREQLVKMSNLSLALFNRFEFIIISEKLEFGGNFL